jgi:acetyltransferase
MGLSLFVTLGNRIDVNENELLEYMAQDDNTRIIIMYLENFADPVRFLEVAREITRKKPIIALKAGKSTHGAAAAASHTGQLAQSDRMVGALLEKAGVIRVSSVGEMIMAAKALYSGVIPEREELAVITNAGGFGVLAIDRAEELGIRLAEFADGTTRALKESLPPEASCKNPVDLLGTATEVQYGTALEWVLKDPGVGGVVYNFGPPVMQKADPIAQKAVEIAARFPGKPVLSIYMNRHRVMEPLRDARGVYVSQFAYPEDAVWAYGKLMEYRSIRNRGREEVPDPPRDREKVAEILKNAAGEGRANLNFDEAQEVLAAYGIPSAKSVVLMPGENPAAKTACLRFPVAIKPNWGGIVHKTEMKAVRLGLQSPGDVEKAAGEISGSISRHTGEAYRGGFVVQEMASDSQEVILGAARQDSGIPLLMFGLGGIFVELLKDVAFAVPPLSEAGADRLIAATKGSLLLEGYRGKPGFARQDARDALVRLSLLIAEHSAIREIDVNPFMVSAEQGKSLAVDVRIIL